MHSAMTLPMLLSSVAATAAPCSRRPSSTVRAVRGGRLVVRSEKKSQRTGYVSEDNSGKGNIFAVEPTTVYLSSPERDARAKEGLGSPQALAAVALTVAALGFATVNGVLLTPEAPVEAWETEALQPLSYWLSNL